MEAVRQIVDTEQILSIVDLPPYMTMYNKVEVIILPTGQTTKQKINHKALKALKGSLKKYANPKSRALEKEAWSMAVEDNRHKYVAS